MIISIIIPVYNVELYIEECLCSVMAQTYTGMVECLIVDDCGTDESMTICEHLISMYRGSIDFKILRHEHNKGLSAARNTGIRAAKGDYLYFLDSDDYITSNCIEVLVENANEYPDVDIVQGNILENEKFSWMRIDNMPNYSDDKHWIAKHIFTDIPMTVWNKLIRKDFVISNNFYFVEGLIHEDEHWRFMSYSHILSIAFCKNPTYFYRIRGNSIMNDGNESKRRSMYLKIIDDILSRKLYVECSWSARFLLFDLLRACWMDSDIQNMSQYKIERKKRIHKIAYSNFIPIRTRLLCWLLLLGFDKYPTCFGRIFNFMFCKKC